MAKCTGAQAYAWTVVVASASLKFISSMLTWGALPILVNFWIKDGLTTSDIAWITTVLNFMAYCTAPLSNWIVMSTRLWQGQIIAVVSFTVGTVCTAYATTTWQIIITFSILNGFGSSLSFITSITAVKLYVSETRRANAYPVVWVGCSAGSMLGPLLVQALLTALGRQGLLALAAGQLILGGATVVIYMDVCSKQTEALDEQTQESEQQDSKQEEQQQLLMAAEEAMHIDTEKNKAIRERRDDSSDPMDLPSEQEDNSEPNRNQIESFKAKLINVLKQNFIPMKDPIFLLILLYLCVSGFGIITYHSYNVWYAVQTGIPELEAAVGPTIKGAASLLASIFLSLLGGFIKQPIVFHVAMAALNGVTTLLFAYLDGSAMFYVLSCLYFTDTAICANLIIMLQILGDQHLETRTALCYAAKGLGYMIGPVIAAALIEAIGISSTFLIGGVVNLAGCLLSIPMLYKYVFCKASLSG